MSRTSFHMYLTALGVLVAATCSSGALAFEKPQCTSASKRQCTSQMELSFDDPVTYGRAKRYCDAVRAACAAQGASRVPRLPQPGTPGKPIFAAATPAPQAAASDDQRLFVRADPLDNPYPGLTQSITAGQAVGASFGYTRNDFVQMKSGSSVVVSNSQSITINGLATYLLAPARFIGDYVRWVPAMWISANGNWDNPTKQFGDTSALKVGPKAEFLLYPQEAGGFLNYVDIAPFYQTDFYGIAQAGGMTVGWSPINYDMLLGGSSKLSPNALIDGFWELRAEATDLDVSVPGHTNLIAHNYEWVGGAARAYLFFFPTRGGAYWSPYLNDRLSLVGTVQSYWDVNGAGSATLYSAALQYKLTCDTKPNTVSGSDLEKKAPNMCSGGSATVSLQYDNGRDRDTLQEKKMLQLKLNYAY